MTRCICCQYILLLMFMKLFGYVYPEPASAQIVVLEENFESADLAAWNGDLHDFTFVSEEGRTLLRLDSEAEPSRTQLRTEMSSAYGSWEFYVRQEFAASNLNRAFIFLMADREDLNYLDGSRINGYAIRTGENGDPKRFRLIRFDDGQQREILSSQTVIEADTGYRLKVTRAHNGEWQIHTGMGYNSTPAPDSDTVVDTIHSQSLYFGFLLRYTSVNSDRFFFDDIRVLSDPGPLKVTNINTVDMQTLDIQFNREPDPSSLNAAHFRLASGPQSVQAEMNGNDRIFITFPEHLPGGPDFLHIEGVSDLHGYETNPDEPFKILIALAVEEGDVVINEIMFDPIRESEHIIPGQSEYIELYNRRNYAISLDEFHLRDQYELTTAATVMTPVEQGQIWIRANGYLLLYPETESENFASSRIAQFFNLPPVKEQIAIRFHRSTLSLPLSGRPVILSDKNGNLIDRVDYRPGWHNPNIIDTRGISLERIDPHSSSNDRSNWSSNTTAAGGTPGRQNTLYQSPGQGAESIGLVLEPNPFSPDGDGHEDHLFIHYKLDKSDYLVRIRIFDRYGRRVRTLADSYPAGFEGSLIWDGRTDSGQNNRIGIYILLFEAYNSSTGANRSFRETVVIARQF